MWSQFYIKFTWYEIDDSVKYLLKSLCRGCYGFSKLVK